MNFSTSQNLLTSFELAREDSQSYLASDSQLDNSIKFPNDAMEAPTNARLQITNKRSAH